MMSKAPARATTIVTIAGLLYFAEGLPYGLFVELIPLYLRERGVDLTQIGLISGLGILWTLKFLWSPLVDQLATYRSWIIGAEVALSASMAILALGSSGSIRVLWVAAALLVFASATQDIAIDAATIVMTPEPLLGHVNAARIATYRIAIILAGGLLAIPATAFGWNVTFALAAAIFLILGMIIYRLPLVRQTDERRRESVSAALRHIAGKPGLPLILAIALLYKLGDAALAPMVKPLWVDRGFSAAEIGTVTTTLAFTLTILGAMAGAAVVRRIGIAQSLIWLGVLQLLSNVGYAVAAGATAGAVRAPLYSAAIIESFTQGLGTAAFLSFLMSVCEESRAATEYALLTATFGLSRTLVSMVSGAASETMGYAGWFWTTVLLGLPALLIILARRRDERVFGVRHFEPETHQ